MWLTLFCKVGNKMVSQGNPMSPMLFIVAMEVLNLLLSKVIEGEYSNRLVTRQSTSIADCKQMMSSFLRAQLRRMCTPSGIFKLL